MTLAPDLCGTVLEERYELHALIGEGAFGRVYRGRDRRLHRAVAVKVIKPWWAEDPDWAEGFVREARLLAAINDPGIVAIHDVGHGPEGPYYVSELVEGENLAVRLRAGPIAAVEARAIALGLCRGLAAAHALRIIHRDVKPANVLLTGGSAGSGGSGGSGRSGGSGGRSDVRVKVTDFGVARLAESTTGAGTDSIVAGTPRYMAPEQARGGAVTPAVDVYSAGAVLYEMLAGRPPFDGVSAVELALAHLSDPPPDLPDGVPADLRRVVARALAKDPADRYPDADAMAHALAGSDPGVPEGADLAAAGRPHVADVVALARQAGESDHTAAGSGPAAVEPPGGVSDHSMPHGENAQPDATRQASRRTPRTNVDPAARRRRAAVLLLVLAVLGGLIAAALLSTHQGHARRRTRFALAPLVEVPLFVDEQADAASALLRALHLRARVIAVPAPGIRPGTVTSQSPVAGRTARAGSAVTLEISEVPRWRTVTTFTTRSSPPLRIVGERWRIIATASGAHHCSLLVFCHSSSVAVSAVGASEPLRRVTLGDGTDTPTVFATGPGTYQVSVHPASGSTRWSIEVQDDY